MLTHREGAIHAKVLPREQAAAFGKHQHLIEQFNHRIVLKQPSAVLGEHRRYPHRIVHRKPNEPAIEQVVLRLLHQLALRSDAVEHLQQHGTQKLLWGDGGSTALALSGIHAGQETLKIS